MTHSQQLLLSIQSIFTDDFTPTCRDWTARLSCAICEPRFGTGQLTGICQPVCNQWFQACRTDMFAFDDMSQTLVPCSQSSLVCWRLDQIVSSGAEFCTNLGYEVGKPATDEELVMQA
jgi:Folate receptor family